MKKGNRFVAILLAAMLATGSMQMYAFAGEAATSSEAIENAVAYEDAEPEAVSDTAANQDFEANTGEPSAEEDPSTAEKEDVNFTEDSSNADNETATSGSTETAAEEISEEFLTSFTITLEGNGGVFVNEWDDILKEEVASSEVLNRVLPAGDAVTSFPVYAQENQEVAFLGWSLERDGDLITQGYEEYVPTEDCVLFAVWEITESTETDEEEVLEPDMDISEEPALPEADVEESTFNENTGDEGYEDADGEAADSEQPDSSGEL